MKKQKFKFPGKLALIILIIFLALFFLLGYIWSLLTTSDYFVIREITAKSGPISALDYLKGRNIFSVDLKRESWKALLGCADCRNVKISRVLPGRLFVDFIKRQPVALARLYKFFVFDADGVFFPAPPEAENINLPVVYGLESKIFGPKPAGRYNIKEVRLALEIIKEFKASSLLSNFQLKKINLANLQSASFFILLPRPAEPDNRAISQLEYNGFEVKIGYNNIREKIVILGGLILQAKKDLANIEYVDLRFKEPVIKLNNVK